MLPSVVVIILVAATEGFFATLTPTGSAYAACSQSAAPLTTRFPRGELQSPRRVRVHAMHEIHWARLRVLVDGHHWLYPCLLAVVRVDRVLGR